MFQHWSTSFCSYKNVSFTFGIKILFVSFKLSLLAGIGFFCISVNNPNCLSLIEYYCSNDKEMYFVFKKKQRILLYQMLLKGLMIITERIYSYSIFILRIKKIQKMVSSTMETEFCLNTYTLGI